MAFTRTCFFISLFAVISNAHFLLTWPPVRGFDDDALVQYPCGGQNEVSAERTSVPINSPFPVQLDMHHTSSNVQIVLALGNNPTGDDFKYVLRPTFSEDGPRDFCVGGLVVPMSVAGGSSNSSMVREGMNGTILAMTNGDPSGGLFNCADVTFTSTPLSSTDYDRHCSNSTGVTATLSSDLASKNANETSEGEGEQSGSSAPTKPNAATQLVGVGAMMFAMVAGAAVFMEL